MADGEEAATAYTIGWEPQLGPQTALLACPVFEVFFGGARGGGKTDGMLGEWASHADLHGRNAVGLMVRRERVQLLETIERSRQIYGPVGARYNDQDKMWRWPNGARLRFAYLERDDADADATASAQHAASIRTIPALQHDPARPEDVNTESEDHAGDEWRYACMSRPFVPVPVTRIRSVPDVGYAAFRSAAPEALLMGRPGGYHGAALSQNLNI